MFIGCISRNLNRNLRVPAGLDCTGTGTGTATGEARASVCEKVLLPFRMDSMERAGGAIQAAGAGGGGWLTFHAITSRIPIAIQQTVGGRREQTVDGRRADGDDDSPAGTST